MAEFKYQVGQRVRLATADTPGPAVVQYRYLGPLNTLFYVIRRDGHEAEFSAPEKWLEPAPLVRGSVVQRDQADSIPAGTVVRSKQGYFYKRRDELNFPDWLAFGSDRTWCDDDFGWPVTVIEPAADDE